MTGKKLNPKGPPRSEKKNKNVKSISEKTEKKDIDLKALARKYELEKEKEAQEIGNVLAEQPKQNTVIWEPHRGVQTEFLSSTEEEVLFAGGRGSGKSDCMMVDPLRYCGFEDFRGLVLRRTMPELRELISRAKDIYLKAYPGTKWKEQEKLFVFPSGARMEFGYCEKLDDLQRYQGQQYQWIGIDEITQFKDEEMVDKLKASMRTTNPNIPIQFRATTNPNGAGRGWVKRRWNIDTTKSGESQKESYSVSINGTERVVHLTKKWFNSTIQDNPALLENNPTYLASLASIKNETLRKQWLEGDWSAAEGLAFEEFNPEEHVVVPFKIPQSWYKFRACDWGFSSMAVCLWFAVDPRGTVYVYREYATKKETADVFGQNILDKENESGEFVSMGYLDSSVWSKRGERGETPAETMMRLGLNWSPSDRSPGSRISSKLKVHEYLAEDPDTGKPRLQIFNTCKELIQELEELPLDDKKPEDVDTDAVDHAYDALRYGLQSRPDVKGGYQEILNQNRYRKEQPIIINNTTGM